MRPLDQRVSWCKAFDVPPWVADNYPRPRFARLRWMLRRVFPRLVWR